MGDVTTFESPVLSIEQDEYVATVWLDRPEARNAMGMDLWRDLPRAMAAVSGEPAVRAVVIAAKGPHFSVGLDLKAMGGTLSGGMSDDAGSGSTRAPSLAARARAGRSEVLRLQDAITSVAICPKPTVAAVHGYCIGGGVDLIAACDIRLASADAVFSVREAKMAIVADLGSLQRLPAVISAGHLNELALTGKDISAERARRHRARQRGRGRCRGDAQGRPGHGVGDRGQLPDRRPGDQGRPGGQRRPDGGAGA